MREKIFPTPVYKYLYAAVSLPKISEYLIELEMPIQPIYYAPADIKPDVTQSVRIFSLYGDEKI